MKNKSNYTIYKMTSPNNDKSYILALKPENEEAIISYLISYKGDIPTMERITNALELLNQSGIIIERLSNQIEEYKKLSVLITTIRRNIQMLNVTSSKQSFTTPLTQSDINILSLK